MFGHYTYIIFELVWALPIVLGEWLLGQAMLRRHVRLLLIGTLAPAVYFSGADAIAIHARVWTLNPVRTLGLWLGPVPLEEAIFFLVTNLMVVQGLLLLSDTSTRVPLSRVKGAIEDRGRSMRGTDPVAEPPSRR